VSGSVTFIPNAEDLKTAYALNMSRSWKPSLLWFVPIGALAGVTIALFDSKPTPGGAVLFGVALLLWLCGLVLVFYGFMRFFWLPRFAKRVFAQQKELHENTEISWGPDGFTAANSTGRTTLPWADFHGWKRGKTMLLLYRSEAMFNFLPLAEPAYARAADEMIRHLRAAGVEEI
jgi:YcxB-like protein